MTRAARDAQRPGAAALRFIFALRDEYCATPPLYLPSSFFVPFTPARWLRRWDWVGAGPPGSTVLHGSGGRTGKALICLGSVVPFFGPSRDVRADAAARACVREPQNHRTTEPIIRKLGNPPIRGREAVLSRFCGSASNIKWGGYSPRAFAVASSAAQGLDRGAAGEKFSAWARRPAAPIGAAELDRGGSRDAAGNGGFPPFFGRGEGCVGTRSLECARIVEADQRLAPSGMQPAGLADRGAPTPPGGRDLAEGGHPPQPRAVRPLPPGAADFSRFERPSNSLTDDGCVVRNRRQSSRPKTGSGVSELRRFAMPGRGSAARGNRQERVGVDVRIPGWGRSRTTTLETGGQGVN